MPGEIRFLTTFIFLITLGATVGATLSTQTGNIVASTCFAVMGLVAHTALVWGWR